MLLLCFKRRLQTNQNRTHGPLLRICAGYASFQEVLFMSKSHRSKSVAAVLAAVLALGMVPLRRSAFLRARLPMMFPMLAL